MVSSKMANSPVVELREMNVAHPSAEDLTKALKGASVQRLALELGVPWEDIITLDDFAKKWLESDPNASWERLASALVKIAMDSPPAATALKPTVNPESGNILIKVVLCGPVSGKTTLVYRFTTGRSRAGMTPATIGAEFAMKAVSVSGETVKLQMWDTGACLTALHGLNSSKLLTVYFFYHYYRAENKLCNWASPPSRVFGSNFLSIFYWRAGASQPI